MSLLNIFLSYPACICFLCLLIFLASLYFSASSRKSTSKLPPGPTPLPIIGNLHLLDIKRQDKSLLKLAKKYGPVFTLHFGFQKVVVLTGYEAVRDALVNFTEEFVDRPPIPIFEEIQRGNGVFFSTGELWRTTRRFTMSSMRNLGMGKKLIEERIIEELSFLVQDIKSFEGKPFNLRTFNIAPTNITFVLLFGERFDYKDPIFITLLKLIDEVMCLLGSPFLHDTSKKENIFNDDNLIASILDLVMAGTETTATTLQWAVLLVMKYPTIQKKVQEEIGQVVKAGSWATYEDRKNMPYTNAVIHEVQRFITLLPHVPRCTSVDTHFRGYFLPKGTMVIPSLTSVLLDQNHWETPHDFNPNHFLDANGKFIKKEAFMPYSSGRRNCIGESLAKMELFVFFTGLLQTFTFQPPPGLTEMDLDLNVPKTTFTLRPQPQPTCAIPRE
ncbi:cytochrome P450 2W1-like isoform X2 [Rhineura floridana]|uniref:cytochrome P450 2W1-like isoform X2 n=1 Tax=Rhineura floridana TaxID=261503 RepID=UPI002AC85C88|nr:cytochrome P450 2W1-like isoform X2 [Rhineura floridana]